MADGDPDPPLDDLQRADEEDPYEGEDLSEYPNWWQENVREFRAHGLRPYRPPRFADGTLVSPTVVDLEEALGVDIRIRVLNPERGRKWQIEVDEEPVARIEKRRLSEGYSEYGMTADGFEASIRRAVEANN